MELLGCKSCPIDARVICSCNENISRIFRLTSGLKLIYCRFTVGTARQYTLLKYHSLTPLLRRAVMNWPLR